MTTKIITPGTDTYRATCSECGCKFTYQSGDVHTNYVTVVREVVGCPHCGYQVSHFGAVPSASIEFTAGRILWTVDGVPIDARKPAVMGECCVLGCDKPTHADSAFCSERHGGAEPPPER